MIPKVSIIIPAYNVAKHINETIQSVKNQTYTSWECVLINDGSKDSTHNKICDAIFNDNRFSYINQENQGVSSARNNGIIKAIGEYILCLDGDDLISTNFLSEMVCFLENDNEVKVVTSNVKFFGKASGELKRANFEFKKLLAENQMVVTSMFRKSDFIKYYQFDSKMVKGLEDWDFWIGLLKNGGKVMNAPNAIFFYRIQRKSRNSNLNDEMQSKLRYQMWLNHKEEYSKHFVDPKWTEEYKLIKNSFEFRLGKFLLKPLRYIKRFF